MHKLDRASVICPECLSHYDYTNQAWKHLKPDCKSLLRSALVEMQGIPEITTKNAQKYGIRCAYCESSIFHEGHIEHFRRKNAGHFPEFTFEWTNLFLACGAQQHCGHYKDRPSAPAYNPNHLIKPDEQDPEHYLYFHSSGEVRVKEGLNNEDKHKATETIRVFGLNNAPLPSARAQAVSQYKKLMLEELDEIASWDDIEREEYLQGEIERTRWDAYSTTIKHFLQKQN